MGDEDKQFDATPQKLKKARDEGQVVKSKDFSTALSLLVLFAMPFVTEAQTAKWLIKPKYNAITDFGNGMYKVKAGRYYGIIDSEGKTIVATSADSITTMTEEHALILQYDDEKYRLTGILNEDKTETGYTDPKTMEGIQCWIDFIDKGLSPSAASLAETSADAMFEGNQLAMNFAGSYMVPEYASNETIKDKIDCVEVPTFNGVEDNCINGLGYAVYEGSKNKEAAEAFAIWLGSEEAQKIQGETGVVISAREDAQQYFAKANEQYNLAAYTNHSAEAYPLPVCNKAAELYDMEATWLTKAYTGEMSLADACAGLKEEADALLAK